MRKIYQRIVLLLLFVPSTALGADTAIPSQGEPLRDPKQATEFYDLGMEAFANDDYQKAVAQFDRAIQLDPTKAKFFRVRGMAWYRRREPERANADFDEAIRLISDQIADDPKNAQHYYDRGKAWHHRSIYDRAIADFDMANELNPELPNLVQARQDSVDMQEVQKLTEEHLAFVQSIRHPKRAYDSLMRASLFVLDGDYDRALADYEKASSLVSALTNDPDPDSSKVLNMVQSEVLQRRMLILRLKGEHPAALSCVNDMVEQCPERAGFVGVRAQLHIARLDYANALADLKTAIRLDPTADNLIHSSH